MARVTKARQALEDLLIKRLAAIHRDIVGRVKSPDELAPTEEERDRRKWSFFWPLFYVYAVSYNENHRELGSIALPDAEPSDETILDQYPGRGNLPLPPVDGPEMQTAVDWSLKASEALTDGMARTERKRQAKAIKTIKQIDREAEQGKINQTVARAKKRGELQDAVSDMYGKGRIERVAATEVTRSVSAGKAGIANRLRTKAKVKTRRIWITERDDKVCPICVPNHRKTSDFYDSITGPPPAHINCRCEERFEIIRGQAN